MSSHVGKEVPGPAPQTKGATHPGRAFSRVFSVEAARQTGPNKISRGREENEED